MFSQSSNVDDLVLSDITGTATYMYWRSSGVGIGTSAPAERLHVDGNILATGAITPGSSRSLKQDIMALSVGDAIAAVMALEPIRFRYRADPADENLGFIAEEVPNLLASKDRKGVNPSDIAAALTAVVQAQQQTIEDQRRAIEALERRLSALESRTGIVR